MNFGRRSKLVDRINKYKVYVFILPSLIFSLLYSMRLLRSIKSSIGNTLTFSSIVLAVLSAFLNFLVGYKNKSFLKRVNEYERLNNISFSVPNYLSKIIRTSIDYSLIFIIINMMLNFIPKSFTDIINAYLMIILRFIVLFIWTYLFCLIMWDVYYVTRVTIDMKTYSPNKDKNESKKW